MKEDSSCKFRYKTYQIEYTGWGRIKKMIGEPVIFATRSHVTYVTMLQDGLLGGSDD